MLRKVLLSSDVFSFCAAHAYVTEKEEIMGLLVGEKVDDGIYKVSSALALKRSDKKPDRVEISPEQLSQATSHVESLSEKLQRCLSIVGWYHSHPHITAMPSDVDIRTQASYQLLDQCFIGLILSVFNTSQAIQVNRMQVCCFQSILVDDGSYERVDVSIEVVPTNCMSPSVLHSFSSLPSIFFQEESEVYESFQKTSPQQPFTCLFNNSIFTKNLIKIMESIHMPLISYYENEFVSTTSRIQNVREEKERLKKELEALKYQNSFPITTSEVGLLLDDETLRKVHVSNVSRKCDSAMGLTVSSHALSSSTTINTFSSSSSKVTQTKTKSPQKFYGETSI